MTETAFQNMAKGTSSAVGRSKTFFVAVGVVILWAATGPFFHFSDTWQLVINTGTTIVTFLMVFLIQNTQNRDTRALQLKLDELLRANRNARNRLVDLENMSDEDLQALEEEFQQLHERACEEVSERAARRGHAHSEEHPHDDLHSRRP